MVNPRQRRKSRTATHKKTRPSRRAQRNLRKMKPIRGPKALQEAWDRTKTVKQNYDAIGLVGSLKMTDPGGTEKHTYYPPLSETSEKEKSQIFGRIIRDEAGSVIDVQLPEENSSEGAGDNVTESDSDLLIESSLAGKREVVQALEKLSRTPCLTRRHTSDAETTALKKLISKHGNSYDAMAKDLRLNRWQRTSGYLQRACKKAGLA